jgi:DNA polymerase (family 10)
MANDRGMKLNEYGLFQMSTNQIVAREKEEDIYRALGLRVMPPEMRESRGEIEASMKGKLPTLVELKDIRGDFHVHSLASDGSATIEEIAYAAKRKGYEYVGITDHSQSLGVANGLSVERLHGNMDIARNIMERVEGVKVLIGAEVEILEDGSLDYPNDVLKELDYVIGAVHSKFKMPEEEMTKRLLSALSNEHLTILAHPTGRVLEQREPYLFDKDKVFQAAKDGEVCLELNAYVERLDLSDVDCMKAKEMGAKVAIGTDAHSLPQLDYMFFGVATARRGWLEPKNVLNCLSLPELVDFLRR